MEYTTKTLQYGSATLIIHRPVLTDTERAKRERSVQETLGRVMGEYLRRKNQNLGGLYEQDCNRTVR